MIRFFIPGLLTVQLLSGCGWREVTRCPAEATGPIAAAPTGKRADIAPARLEPTPAPKKASPPATSPVLLAQVAMAAVGDVITHGEVLRAAEAANLIDEKGRSLNNAGFDVLLEGVSEELAGSDLVFANLETPVAPVTGDKSVPFSFNGPPELLGALSKIGVNLVSFANNHVYDQKRKGLVESLDQLDASGLVYAGAGRTCKQAAAAKIVERNGIKLAFLAASTLYNQRLNRTKDKACAFEFDEKVVLAQVAAAKKAGAQLAVLSLHWGAEYHTAPRQVEIELAYRLLEGGVDVLLGHHPHVLQPVEVYRTSDGRIGLIAYSLGNFLSNQSRYYLHGLQPEKMGNTRDGAILRFSIVKKAYGHGVDSIERIELAKLSVEPLWTDNNALDRKRDAKLPVAIREVVNHRAAAEAQAKLACERDPNKRIYLMRQVKLYLDRRRVAGAVLGEDLLSDPPSSSKSSIACPSANPEPKKVPEAGKPDRKRKETKDKHQPEAKPKPSAGAD